MRNLQQKAGDLLPRCLIGLLPLKTPFPPSERGCGLTGEKKDDRPNPISAIAKKARKSHGAGHDR